MIALNLETIELNTKSDVAQTLRELANTIEADFKAKKKLDKRTEGYVRVGGCLFKLDYLIKAVRFMEHVGTDVLMLSPDGRRAALAVSGDSKMILMPVYPRTEFEDNEVCYGL